MGKILQIVHVVMILVTVTVNMTNAQGEVISVVAYHWHVVIPVIIISIK